MKITLEDKEKLATTKPIYVDYSNETPKVNNKYHQKNGWYKETTPRQDRYLAYINGGELYLFDTSTGSITRRCMNDNILFAPIDAPTELKFVF